MTKFLGYGYFKFYHVPGHGSSSVHPVVQDWMARVVANSGTYDSKDVTALDTLIRTWEGAGLIESGLASGQTSAASAVQYVIPCCGTNAAAARIPLLYRSGSSAPLTDRLTPSYSAVTKTWTLGTSGLYTSYTPSTYGTVLYKGMISVRQATGGTDSGGFAASGGGFLSFVYPRYTDGIGYFRMNNTASDTVPTVPIDATPAVYTVNLVSLDAGVTVTNYAYKGSTILGTNSPTPVGFPTGSYLLNEATVDNPMSFFACSVESIPTASISTYVGAIETFRASVV